jgi:O-antigen ligase
MPGRRKLGLPAPQAGLFHEPPSIVVLAFLGFIVFWYLQGGYRIPALGTIRFELIVGSLLSLYALLASLGARPAARDDLGAGGVIGWSIVLLALMLIWVAFSASPAYSFQVFIDRPLKMAMIGLMISSFVTSPRVLTWFLGAYLLAFLKMTQEGVLGYVTGVMVWENQGTPRLHGSTPMYAHPNSLAGTQLGTIPFLFGLLPLARKWLRIAMLAQIIGTLAIVVVSGSRTAYVALFGWTLYRIARSTHKLRALIIVAAIVAVAVQLVPTEYHERFASILTGQDKEGGSIAARKEILADAWEVFISHPLGVGVGAFPIVREQMFGRQQDTHNLYLEVATNLGIPGLLAFVALLLATFGALRRIDARARALLEQLDAPDMTGLQGKERAEKLRKSLRLVRTTCDALMGFLVIRLYLGMFGMDLYEVYWWFAAGLTVALGRIVSAIDVAWAPRAPDRPSAAPASTRRSQHSSGL